MHCGGRNGEIQKVSAMKLVHLPWGGKDATAAAGRFYSSPSPSSLLILPLLSPSPFSRAEYTHSFEEAKAAVPDLEQYISKAGDDLHPIRVRDLFELIPLEDYPFFDMKPERGRVSDLVLTHLMVPPASIRPSVSSGSGTNEDDLTVQIRTILAMNRDIKKHLDEGHSYKGMLLSPSPIPLLPSPADRS